MSILGWIIGGTIAATLLSGSDDKTEQKKEVKPIIIPCTTFNAIRETYDIIYRVALPIHKAIVKTKREAVIDYVAAMKEYDVNAIINYLERQKNDLIAGVYIRGNDVALVNRIEVEHQKLKSILRQAEPKKVIQEQKVEVPQVIDEDDDFIENLIKESQDQLNNIDDIL